MNIGCAGWAAFGGDASAALSERGVRGDRVSRHHGEHGYEDWPLLHWSTPLAYKDAQSVRAFTAHRQVAVRFKMEWGLSPGRRRR